MGSIGNPRTWVPYMNTKDCSQGFCSLYCPQWCYIIFPPPPPVKINADVDDPSGPNFSPLVIAIIGILASAFLLVSYYTIISKYCGKGDSTRRRRSENYVSDDHVEVMEDNHNPSGHDHDAWRGSSNGLDEALIKSITVFKYKKGDTDDGGLIEVTDCSVCLSEFVEDESLRLLPKCSHAFHVQCIDTWLKSHSNCPLCRADIISVPTSVPPPVTETTPGVEQPSNNENLSHAISDLSNPQGRDHIVIDIRGGGEYDHQQMIMRRSVSMDHFGEPRGPVVDILHTNREGIAGSSKQSDEGSKTSSNRMNVLNCVMNPAAMKRSFSSGRLFLTRQGRVRDLSIPL